MIQFLHKFPLKKELLHRGDDILFYCTPIGYVKTTLEFIWAVRLHRIHLPHHSLDLFLRRASNQLDILLFGDFNIK